MDKPTEPPNEHLKKALDILRQANCPSPNNISKEGCLALARAGKAVWNAWREAHPVNNAKFDSCNFISEPIDFSGFVFGGSANFAGTQFGNMAQFEGAQFGHQANFAGAQFGGWANFAGAKFGNWADFGDARFGDRANFEGAQFGDLAQLKGAQFRDWAGFAGAQFGLAANFEGAQFGGWAQFAGAQFGNRVDFAGAQFGDRADFSGVNWALTRYGNQADKRKTWAEQRGLAPNRFQHISFQGASFKGAVDFSNREFTGSTLFSPRVDTPTTFATAPLFHNATLHPDTSFDGVQFLDVGEPDRDRASIESAAHAYRTLKLAFSGQQATRQEQQFLRLEMAEEALLAPSVREWLRGQREHDLPPRFYYTIYRLLSDYGFSIWRPVVLLLASLSVLFLPWLALGWGAWFLWCVMGTPTKKERGKSSLLVAWLVAIFAALLVGIVIALLGSPVLWLGLWQAVSHCDLCGDYVNVAIPALFPSPFSSHGFDWGCIAETSAALQTVQKVLAVLAWFLIGLALRNRFKMK